jgi:hypothetical protein
LKYCNLTMLLVGISLSLTLSESLWAQDSTTVPPQEEQATTTTSAEVSVPAPPWQINFSALEQYRFRAFSKPLKDSGDSSLGPPVGSESDHLFRLSFDGDIRNPDETFGVELSLGLWATISRSGSVYSPSTLTSMYDYRRTWWDVFTLYAEYTPHTWIRLLRAGRQTSEHGPPLTFDGASALFAIPKNPVTLFVFGGRTAHFFEPRSTRFEDWVASVGVGYKPFSFLRLELDYRFLKEDVLTYVSSDKSRIVDHSYGLSSWFNFLEASIRAKVQLRGLNDRLSQAGVSGQWVSEEGSMGITLGFEAQPVTLREINEAEDPFYSLLGDSLPNFRYKVDFWKSFDLKTWTLGFEVGLNGRQLLRGEEGPFNRNTGRVYVMLDEKNLLLRGLYFQLGGEGDYRFVGGNCSLAVFGALGYERERLKAEIGTYYQRYKYDYFQNAREIADVRTYYLSFSYAILKWLGVKVQYEFERFDRDIHTVVLSLRQRV